MRNAGLIIFDLDNTLVDKNRVFQEAQEKMIEIIRGTKAIREDMKALREMDSLLIEKKRTHVYPFEILGLSLWFYYFRKLTARESVQRSLDVFQDLENAGDEMRNALDLAQHAATAHNSIIENTPAPLFDGVRDVLRTLKNNYFLALLTEGNPRMQEKTLKTHQLKQYFNLITYCNRKDRKAFLQIKNHFHTDKRSLTVVVVGDGIEREIEPGNEIGAITIWKPGDFNAGTPSSGMKRPHYCIKDIRELPSTLSSLLQRTPKKPSTQSR